MTVSRLSICLVCNRWLEMNKPEWLKRGALVKVQHWYGLVEDVAVSDQHVMVLIKSPKGIWRNQRNASEWLEYIEGSCDSRSYRNL